MVELSSNWKKLQAKIKAESASKPAAPKRKADDSIAGKTKEVPRKKQKQQQDQRLKPSKQSDPSSKGVQSKPKPSMGNTQSSKIDPIPPKHGV